MWFNNLNNNYSIRIYLFKKTEYLVIKTNFKNIIYFYTNYYNYLLTFNNNNKIYINSTIKFIFINSIRNIFLFYYNYIIKSYILFIYKFFFLKFKFQGKGYYIFKNKKNNLAFQFNFSHKINYYYNSVYINNFSKKSWMFISLNSANTFKITKEVLKLRRLNVFTNRGVRLHKQVVYLKKKK